MHISTFITSLCLSTFLFFGCGAGNGEKITNKDDYQHYLVAQNQAKLIREQENLLFWENKLSKTPSQHPYLVKIAAANTALFSMTGDIRYLKNAEKKLLAANKKSISSGNMRALARNYISQHKFQEALVLLEKAEANGENLMASQKMLFDVHLELGNHTEAEKYLKGIAHHNDFDYLIRASKWSDTTGDLDSAISYLQRALAIAEASKNKELILWSYTNLADFYGHNNEVKRSYEFYLKSLAIDPTNAYAKKGIAWIVYSHEKNPEEAMRILSVVQKSHQSPDYDLLKAEMAAYMNRAKDKKKYLASFLASTANEMYGDMYNQYNAKLYLDEYENESLALPIIEREIKNRPTAASYDLLAWASYKKGALQEALDIVVTYVEGKTHEPEALYHLAEIYKANELLEKAQYLKKELIESSYELGPIMAQKIQEI